MGGIGLALVLARGRLDRVDAGSPLGRASGFVPLAAAFLVFGLGIYLTIQAVAGNTTSVTPAGVRGGTSTRSNARVSSTTTLC